MGTGKRLEMRLKRQRQVEERKRDRQTDYQNLRNAGCPKQLAKHLVARPRVHDHPMLIWKLIVAQGWKVEHLPVLLEQQVQAALAILATLDWRERNNLLWAPPRGEGFYDPPGDHLDAVSESLDVLRQESTVPTIVMDDPYRKDTK